MLKNFKGDIDILFKMGEEKEMWTKLLLYPVKEKNRKPIFESSAP